MNYPTAIVIGAALIGGAILMAPSRADVAGMDRFELRRDPAFRRAVEDLVEDMVEGCSVTGTGWVDGDWLWSFTGYVRC